MDDKEIKYYLWKTIRRLIRDNMQKVSAFKGHLEKGAKPNNNILNRNFEN